jgi:hypothetical protein
VRQLFLVDPDPVRLCVLDVTLRRSGYDVTTVIVTDVRLPKLDGFAFVHSLKAHPELAALPVVFLASEKSTEDQQRALDLGVDEYLTRPLSARELTSHIQLLLARRTRESAHAPTDAPRGGASFAGSTRDLPFADLLQKLETLHESGVAHVRSGLTEAHIFLRNGQVVDAELGPLRGREAVYRALLWDDASFDVEFKPVANKDIVRCPTRVVVMEGMRRVDDWMRLCTLVQPLAALMGVSPSLLLERLRAAGEVPEGRLTARPDLQRVLPGILPGALPNAILPKALAANAESEVGATANDAARSRTPSDAPWATEVNGGAKSQLDDDALAAGVPRAMGRRTKRLFAVLAAVGVVLGIVLLLSAHGTRRQREVDAARDKSAVVIQPAVAAAALRPIQGASEPPAGAPSGAYPIVAIASEVPKASLAVTGYVALPNVTVTGGVVGSGPGDSASSARMPRDVRTLAAPVLATGPKARETALPTRVEMSAHSPLVRDAQRLLLKGETERAVTLAQKAVSEDASDADAWLTLAAARKAAGDLSGAGEAYRACITQARTVGVADCRALGSVPE